MHRCSQTRHVVQSSAADRRHGPSPRPELPEVPAYTIIEVRHSGWYACAAAEIVIATVSHLPLAQKCTLDTGTDHARSPLCQCAHQVWTCDGTNSSVDASQQVPGLLFRGTAGSSPEAGAAGSLGSANSDRTWGHLNSRPGSSNTRLQRPNADLKRARFMTDSDGRAHVCSERKARRAASRSQRRRASPSRKGRARARPQSRAAHARRQ